MHEGTACLGPLLEMSELYSQDCSLKPFHPVIESPQYMMIFTVLPPVAQHANGAREFGVARGYGSAFAIGSQIFTGIKTETGHVSDAADRTAFILCSVRLRGIFDNNQPMSTRDFHDRIHVGGLAIQMHREDRLRAGADRRLDCRWIQRERTWIDIHQNGTRSNV